jgi:hypothetical protein
MDLSSLVKNFMGLLRIREMDKGLVRLFCLGSR